MCWRMGWWSPPPLKRLRKKTTPNIMHIVQNNNITVAYATPLITTTSKTTTITQHNAMVTRGDLLSTSKYYRYHKAMGHTPQHIQQVSGRQKNDFLLKVDFQHTCTNKSISFTIHRSWPKDKKQRMQKYNSLDTQGFFLEDKLIRAPIRYDTMRPQVIMYIESGYAGALLVRASSCGATSTIGIWSATSFLVT